jgi:hypothetical protein
MTLDEFVKNDEVVRFIFEQARNTAVIGLIFAGSLWLRDHDSMFRGGLLFVAAAFLLLLQQFYIFHKIRALKLRWWIKGAIGAVLQLLVLACVISIVKYPVVVPLNL